MSQLYPCVMNLKRLKKQAMRKPPKYVDNLQFTMKNFETEMNVLVPITLKLWTTTWSLTTTKLKVGTTVTSTSSTG